MFNLFYCYLFRPDSTGLHREIALVAHASGFYLIFVAPPFEAIQKPPPLHMKTPRGDDRNRDHTNMDIVPQAGLRAPPPVDRPEVANRKRKREDDLSEEGLAPIAPRGRAVSFWLTGYMTCSAVWHICVTLERTCDCAHEPATIYNSAYEIYSNEELAVMGGVVVDFGMCPTCLQDFTRIRLLSGVEYCGDSRGFDHCSTCNGSQGSARDKCYVKGQDANDTNKRNHKSAAGKRQSSSTQHKKKKGDKEGKAVDAKPETNQGDADDPGKKINPWKVMDLVNKQDLSKALESVQRYHSSYSQWIKLIVEEVPAVRKFKAKFLNTKLLVNFSSVHCPRPKFEVLGGYDLYKDIDRWQNVDPTSQYNRFYCLNKGYSPVADPFVGFDADWEWRQAPVTQQRVQEFLKLATSSYYPLPVVGKELYAEKVIYDNTVKKRLSAAKVITRWAKQKLGPKFWVEEEVPVRIDEPFKWLILLGVMSLVWMVLMVLFVEGFISWWAWILSEFASYFLAALAMLATYVWWNGTSPYTALTTLGTSTRIMYEGYNNFDMVDVRFRRKDLLAGYFFNSKRTVRYPRWMLAVVAKRLASYNSGPTIPGNVRTVLSDDSYWPKMGSSAATLRWKKYVDDCGIHYAHIKNLDDLAVKRSSMTVAPTYQILNFQPRAGRAGYGNPASTTPSQPML